jgi:hypothetical protein
MALILVEIAPEGPLPDVKALIACVHGSVNDLGGTLVESAWAADSARLYLIVEGGARDSAAAQKALAAHLRAEALPVKDVAAVRLVGTPAGEAPATPSHIVEWDLPADLGMERYLKRKAEKSPLYAQVPEVRFLRTYVREDTIKCVCLYHAPDDDAVRRARAAVGAPISRMAQVKSLEVAARTSGPSKTDVEHAKGA